MRVGIDPNTHWNYCGKGSNFNLNDILTCTQTERLDNKVTQLFFRHIRESVEFVMFDRIGSVKKPNQSGSAIEALRNNEIDSVFSMTQLPNFNLPLEEQMYLSRNISYVHVHKVR